MAQGNFKKVGNWGGARKLSTNLKNDIKYAAGIALKRIGLETEKRVVKYIKSQPAEWPPLDEKYKERKIKQGHSDFTLIRTGDYIDRITSIVQPDKMGVFIGVRKGVTMKGSDTEMWQIGAILEYGRKGDKKKARPHFRPMNKEMAKEIKEKDLLGMAVYEHIRRKNNII